MTDDLLSEQKAIRQARMTSYLKNENGFTCPFRAQADTDFSKDKKVRHWRKCSVVITLSPAQPEGNPRTLAGRGDAYTQYSTNAFACHE